MRSRKNSSVGYRAWYPEQDTNANQSYARVLCLCARHPVPLFLHLLQSLISTEVNHSFFQIFLSWSHSLCSVIFGKTLSFQTACILCPYPLTGLPLWSAGLLRYRNVHISVPIHSGSSWIQGDTALKVNGVQNHSIRGNSSGVNCTCWILLRGACKTTTCIFLLRDGYV